MSNHIAYTALRAKTEMYVIRFIEIQNISKRRYLRFKKTLRNRECIVVSEQLDDENTKAVLIVKSYFNKWLISKK